MLVRLVLDYYYSNQDVDWDKGKAYGYWDRYSCNGFDLGLVFAALCSAHFVDQMLGLPTVRIRVIVCAPYHHSDVHFPP